MGEPFIELTPEQRRAILEEEDPDRCECGWLVDEHPPLPKPKPMRSWMSIHTTINESTQVSSSKNVFTIKRSF